MSLQEFCDLNSVDQLNRISAEKFFSAFGIMDATAEEWRDKFESNNFKLNKTTVFDLRFLLAKSHDELKTIAVDLGFESNLVEYDTKPKLAKFLNSKTQQHA